MTLRNVVIALCGFILLLLAGGVAGTLWAARASSAVAAPHQAELVAGGLSYQGQLTGSDGEPLNGNQTMRFVLYDAPVAGSAVWDSGPQEVAVDNGLFTVKLDVDPSVFDGRALWLSVVVGDEQLSPRQELLPAPYAFSLRPGADIVGDAIAANDAILSGRAPATGTALHADSNGGAGVFGQSAASYGVWGESTDSWGGYFTSDEGHGIRVNTNAADHYDHGAYITSNGGYGVYAQSANNQAVRGEAGDVAGIPQPLGTVGVVGLGANRGLHGATVNGVGIYAASIESYGAWAQSTNFRGATGRTSRTDNNYGFYTPDNLYANNTHLTGAVMQIMENGGDAALMPGDVVVFNGLNRDVAAVDGPIVQVRRADEGQSSAVAGVVYSRFNIDAVDPALDGPEGNHSGQAAQMQVTPAGSAAPGEFVLVVVQGPAEVRIEVGSGSAIAPGDLLATGETAGRAGPAAMVTIDGAATHRPGTVLGKALEVYDGQEKIYIYVTLQ